MSTTSKLLHAGEMPVELAKNFEVSVGDHEVSALEHYYRERRGLLVSAIVFIVVLPQVLRMTVGGMPFVHHEPSLVDLLAWALTWVLVLLPIQKFAGCLFSSEVRNFREFDRKLKDLVASFDSWRSSDRPLHLRTWDELCQAAHTRLVDIAYQIHSAVKDGEIEDYIEPTRKLLSERYDLYLFYGLVKGGGYHPFYAEAEKKLAAERAANPSEPAPATSS